MIRSIAQFHEHENLVALAQTAMGQLVIWLFGVVLLLWHEIGLLMLGAFTLVLLFPRQRRLMLAIVAVGVIFKSIMGRHGFGQSTSSLTLQFIDLFPWLPIQAAAVIGCIYVISLIAIQFHRFPTIIKQFPLITLHVLIWIGLALTAQPLLGVLGGYASVLVWRLSYVFSDAGRGGDKNSSFKDHLFYLAFVAGIHSVPYGKGLVYLTRHEATEITAIARSQLAGIKLLFLAIIWAVAGDVMDDMILGDSGKWSTTWLNGWTLGVPNLIEVMPAGSIYSMPVAWASIYLDLIRTTLYVAVTGHVIVGCLRLLGFNVFRNTYKPLLAESIVDFWSRYNFYFKELLVQFFFFPTFLRCTWASPRLRMFIAVFAAAFIGNMYFRLFVTPTLAVTLDFGALWENWGTRFVYCFLLAIGIWVSMLRQQEQRKFSTRQSSLVMIRRIAGVWTFYALIRIWNIRAPEIGFAERFDFTVSLFGF